MANRLDLHALLISILESDEVYFQTPASKDMRYPAIVYSLADIDNRFADNQVYKQDCAYEITVIDYDPDSEIRNKVSKLPMCNMNRHFRSDNLNHYVFTLYFGN